MKALAGTFGIVLALGYVQDAHAAEPEPVRFEVSSPVGCASDADLRAEIATLGGAFRDANLDDRARTFRVEVTRAGARVKGRLVVRDLVFRETTRMVDAASCEEATRSLALSVATALDEAPPPLTLTPAPVSAPPPIWPAPAETDAERAARAPRRGSGGFVVDAFGGFGPTGDARGVRGYAAALVGGSTRIGAAGALTLDERRAEAKHSKWQGDGLVTRFGGFVGWGAPWNDSVVGFGLEGGIMTTNLRGTVTPAVDCAGGMPTTWAMDACYADDLAKPWQHSSVAPYMATQLIFQVPLKRVPVRPVVSIGHVLTGEITGIVLFTGEAGLVWQAW